MRRELRPEDFADAPTLPFSATLIVLFVFGAGVLVGFFIA